MEYYGPVKWLHIIAVSASGLLFFIRGVGVQAGAGFAMAAPLRYLSYTVDTILLSAALALVWILKDFVLASTWLWVKIVLLPVYIVLGSFALKRAKSKPAKLLFFIAALAVFLFIYRVARHHDPMGGFIV